jgi:hypothetical protein
MKTYKVYKITCKINNKIYIGQTYKSLSERLKKHIEDARKGVDTKFYRAMRKYGYDNFEIELLEDCDSQEELDELEWKWIQFYDACRKGYNSKNSKGKCGGDTLTGHPQYEEICKKVSETKFGAQNPNHTPIKALNIITFDELLFDCLKDAQNYFNMDRHDQISKRCRGEVKVVWDDKWAFAYIDDEYSYTDQPLTGGVKGVRVIDTIKKESYEFASYTLAQKYFNFPDKTISRKLRSKNPNTLYENRYYFIPLN